MRRRPDPTILPTEVTAYKGDHFVTCYLVDEEHKIVFAMDTVKVRII